MPTVTFPITTAANDGSGYREAATWAGIGAGAFTDFSDDPTHLIYASKQAPGTAYFCDNLWLRWDTSSIPDSATITAANLIMYLTSSQNNDGYSIVADAYDFGGEPAVAGDWVETPSPNILAPLTLTALIGAGAAGDRTIPFSASGLTAISKTGFTGVRVCFSAGTPVSASGNYLEFQSFENAGVNEPRLEVTYTEAVAPQVPVVRHSLGGGRW